MLGNLLMDVNKPSLWKNGAGRGVDGDGGGGGGGEGRVLSLSLYERGLTLSVIWTKSLQCISRHKINSICVAVLIGQSAIICELRSPPGPHLAADPE